MRSPIKKQQGVSLIAAVFIIVVLGFMGVMFVSLINTSTLTSVNDLQSAQAFNIAEGGVEYEQRIMAQNVDWYRSTDPVDTATRNLGAGSFTASTIIPATELKKRLVSGGNNATVYSTNRFPSSGNLQIGDDLAVDAEIVQYTAIGAGNTFTLVPASVTKVHPRGSNVYPVTTLSQAGGLPASCTAPALFTLATNTKFLDTGTIDVEGEEINYAGLTVNGANMTLTGVQRCQEGGGPVSHAFNVAVTPVLATGVSAKYQAESTSTATVGAAARVVKKTIQR